MQKVPAIICRSGNPPMKAAKRCGISLRRLWPGFIVLHAKCRLTRKIPIPQGKVRHHYVHFIRFCSLERTGYFTFCQYNPGFYYKCYRIYCLKCWRRYMYFEFPAVIWHRKNENHLPPFKKHQITENLLHNKPQ